MTSGKAAAKRACVINRTGSNFLACRFCTRKSIRVLMPAIRIGSKPRRYYSQEALEQLQRLLAQKR